MSEFTLVPFRMSVLFLVLPELVMFFQRVLALLFLHLVVVLHEFVVGFYLEELFIGKAHIQLGLQLVYKLVV